MILGQSVAVAASIAIDKEMAIQDVPYNELMYELANEGQKLSKVE